KAPDERFPSCRDFVPALSRSRLSPAALPAATPAAVSADFAAGALDAVRRTDPAIPLKRKVPLTDFIYEKLLWHSPLGEIWQVQAANGETRWAYHLQGFTLEAAAEQEKAITYLQNLRHVALLRFKIGELAAHRICLLFDP